MNLKSESLPVRNFFLTKPGRHLISNFITYLLIDKLRL